MKITPIGIAAIRAVPGLMQRITDLEGVTSRTVYRWMKEDDSPLTKATILRMIREETGLTDEQILEPVAVQSL